MRPLTLLSVAVLSLTALSASSQASVIQLVCGDEYNVAIDTNKKTVDVYQPNNHATWVDGKITTITGSGDIPYKQTVTIDNTMISFSTWLLPNAPFGQGATGKCDSTVIDRVSGLITMKMGCMLGGAVDFRAQCVPGRAGPQEKKF